MIMECNRLWQYQDSETGLIMPWYTLSALEWLKKQDVSQWAVFEYGAGYSTMWWSLNARMNWAVDDSKLWARALRCNFCEDEDNYIKTIIRVLRDVNNDDDLLDCIVIDGSFRKKCLERSIEWLRSGGHIIIDNYGQEDFPDTEFAEILLEGWGKQIFKQYNHTKWITAVFTKP